MEKRNKPTKTQFDNILRFACLFAEDVDSILGKSPDYILEKFWRYIGDPAGVVDFPQKGLNAVLEKKLVKAYYDEWGDSYVDDIGSPHQGEDFFYMVDQELERMNTTKADTNDELETFRERYLGSKNVLKQLFANMLHIEDHDRKRQYGVKMNALKAAAELKYDILKSKII